MDMRIPFQITSESVKDTDDTGSKVFGFIHFIKHAKDNISNGVKKTTLVERGVKVPEVVVKGLAVMEKMLNKEIGKDEEGE